MNFTKTLDANETSLDENFWQVTSGSGQQKKNYKQNLRGKKEKMEFSQLLTGYAGSLFAQVRPRSVYKAEVRIGTHCA